MNKAILNKELADRLNAPETAGKIVEFERYDGIAIYEIYYEGERIGGRLEVHQGNCELFIRQEKEIE